jgi:hypothetical protein
MRWSFGLTLCLAVVMASAAAQVPASGIFNLHVEETAGIRRFGYPANARVPFPKGAMPDAMHARLLSNHAETPAQYTVESTWPDGSVQWLWVDFNASLAPHEEVSYQLEYGAGVKPEITPKGLKVAESPDAIQVGEMRFSKAGAPLLLSVKYRGEAIGRGPNGFAITDNAGASHDATSIDSLKFELLRRGPVYVVFRYSGQMHVDRDYSITFWLTIEMPNSKSWWKGIATVEDPAGRVRELSFHTPLALGPFPWIWDFGIGSWTYGTFKHQADSVILSQVVKRSGGSEWQILSGEKGHEQVYETTGGRRPLLAEGWGHIQNQRESLAFAVDGFGRQEGKYTIAIDGDGQAAFTFAPARPQTHHQFTLYEHFVAPPAAIGAVTNPVSMLNPLVVFCDRRQYIRSRLPVPPAAGIATSH